MNFSQLEVFCRVASFGSVSEVARQTNNNRSSLSMALKALEKELDTQLFERTGNKLILTEAGKAILKDCEFILAASDRIKQTCVEARHEFAAEIWIARDDSIPDEIWQDLSLQLSKRYPSTSFNMVLASSGDLPSLVESEQVDFAFGVDYELDETPKLKYTRLGKIRMMSVCKADHPLARMRRVEDYDLRNEMQACLAYMNEKENPELKPIARRYIGFTSFDYMLGAILQETAWGVLPEPLIRPHLRQEKLKVIKHTYGLVQEEFCLLAPTKVSAAPGIGWLSEQITDYLFDY